MKLISENNNIKVHLKNNAKVKGKDFHRFLVKSMHLIYVNRYIEEEKEYTLVVQNSNVFTEELKEYKFKVDKGDVLEIEEI